MSKPKELFQRNKEVTDKVIAMLRSDEFEVWMTFTRAEFSHRNPTAEQGRGAAIFESVMRTLPAMDEEPMGWNDVASGAHLHHELEVPINHKPETDKKE